MKNNTWSLVRVLGLLAGGCSTSHKTPTLYATSAVPALANATASSMELPFVVRGVSDDETYGYTAANPVRVVAGSRRGCAISCGT